MAGSSKRRHSPQAKKLADFERELQRLSDEVSRRPASFNAKDIETALEELHNAQEELHQQSDELLYARDQLEEERRRYQDLFEFAPHAYLVTDEHGTIQEANRAAVKLFQIESRFLVGKPLSVYVIRGDAQALRELIHRATTPGTESPSSLVVQLVPRHGRPVYAELIVSGQIDPARQRVAGLRWTVRDVTAEREAQLRIQSLNAELTRLLDQRTGQLQAASGVKDYFLAVISHELRTPLTPVLAVASELVKREDLAPEIREDLSIIQRNVAMEATLIDDLLDLTRAQWGKLRLELHTVDCHEVINNVLSTCKNGSDHPGGANISVDLGAKEHHVKADATRLQQILWNLLKNAIKFTPARGRIWVRTFNPQPGVINIEVRDNGIGIAPEALSRIFYAFEQERQEQIAASAGSGKAQQGLGLGLSISRALAEAQGGRLWAVSEGKNRGSTFTMEFRTVAADQVNAHAPGRPVERTAHGRILLVEDHADTARIMARLLSNLGYSVLTANSVASALDLASHELFDLVISDIGLPDASGLDLMRQLRQRKPVKAIALSGYGTAEDIEKSKDAGFTAHVTKPVDFNQLRSEISRVMA